jgi:hypothetical protein
MRAVEVTEYGATPALVDIPTPEPGPRMVLVKLRPAGMNPMALAPAYGACKPMPATLLSTFALGPERTRALAVWGAIAVVGGAVRLLLGGRSWRRSAGAGYSSSPFPSGPRCWC